MPPEVLNDVEDMDDDLYSPDVADDAGASPEVETPAAVDSSPATDVSNTVADDDTLSIVRDVVEKASPPEAAASSATGEETGQKPDDQEPKKEPDDAEFSDVPFNKHPRFQQVLGKLKAAETDAKRYRNVQNFIDGQGLGAEEAAELLTIGGLIKSNPAEAWKRMQPTVAAVLKAAGEVLSDDLADMVASGQMSREAALEVSRSRASVQSVGLQRQLEQSRLERQRQQELEEQQMAASFELQNTAQTWEDDRRAKDPAFETKLPAVIDEVKRLKSLGYQPTSKDGVLDQLNRAYRAVNARLQPRTPAIAQKPAIRPVTGGQVNGTARPAPRNTLEIINQVMEQRGAR